MGASNSVQSKATLERLLAVEVLRALVARQHLRVAHASHEVLVDELEAAIAPMLSSVTPYLMAAHASMLGELAPAATSGDLGGFGDGSANEAVAVMVDGIGERISHSNHVDDIFVDDATIRRSALRSVQRVLLGYLRGEVLIEADTESATVIPLALDGLGYVVSTCITRTDDATLEAVLVRSGGTSGAEFIALDPTRRTAAFRPRSAKASLLALEESITREVVSLLDAGLVQLPNVEQEFELPPLRVGRGPLLAALRAAAEDLERRASCRARCERIGPRRVRLAVTPLTTETAQHVDALFEELVALVEASLDRSSSPPDSREPESLAAESQTRRRASAPRDSKAPTSAEEAKPVSTRRSSGRTKANGG
ncbi:MAG: hypothetical protein FJ096_07210 [Deltaproteobacteria bacterium]|nr:hypothetical protein [Deltaproteobacteria bacterium]